MKKQKEHNFTFWGLYLGLLSGAILDSAFFRSQGLAVCICLFLGILTGGIAEEIKFLRRYLK